MVERRVVGDVDEELGGGRIGIRGAGHGYGVDFVFQAVVRLVANRRPGFLFMQVAVEAATLDHEIGDYAMKYRSSVKSAFHVLEKVFHGLRRLVRVQFHGDGAEIGFHFHHWIRRPTAGADQHATGQHE